jgi:hypothetical protein
VCSSDLFSQLLLASAAATPLPPPGGEPNDGSQQQKALRAAAKRGRASGPQSDSQSDSQSVQPREPLPSSRAVRRRLSASPFRERQSAHAGAITAGTR